VKLAPSSAAVPLRAKLDEGFKLLRDFLERRRLPPASVGVLADLDEYDALLRRYGGPPLDDARVLEIGYGARPWRLTALQARGVDALGVDAEVPILSGSPREYLEAYRRNGIERAVKSLLRRTLFDRREDRALRDELARRGATAPIVPSAFIVSDAAELDLPEGSIDLIYSEDVFEHIAFDSLVRLLEKMASWLKPDGLALIRPNIFTGITGGHLVEWYRQSFAVPGRGRRSQPWEHLRARRWLANTYLNELSRADYRALFESHFQIAEEVVKLPDLGREFLTPEVAEELSAYGNDELFSNQVLFILRPRRRAQ
jgi:SAM-dependent methyltransferase